MSLLLCLDMVTGAMTAPPEPREDQPTTWDDAGLTRYTLAIPSYDFTLSNVSSPIEEILAAVGAPQDTETR